MMKRTTIRDGRVMLAVRILLFASLALLLCSIPKRVLAETGNINPPIPQFSMPDDNFSNSGHIQLIWKVPNLGRFGEELEFVLQQSRNPQFMQPKTIYKGPDLASFRSGLRAGDYYYRVRSIYDDDKSTWSSPISLKVEYQSMVLAFTLFGIGALVFLATTAVVIHGARNTRID